MKKKIKAEDNKLVKENLGIVLKKIKAKNTSDRVPEDKYQGCDKFTLQPFAIIGLQ